MSDNRQRTPCSSVHSAPLRRVSRSAPRAGRRFVHFALFVLVAITSGILSAQEIQLARPRGPYYVGEGVVVQVQAQGFEAGEQVSCRLQGAPPAGITIEGPQVGQSSQSYTQIINGRMTSSETVNYRFSFLVTADREGEFLIGPFEVTTSGGPRIIEGVSFQFTNLQNDPDMEIAFSMPRKSVYVGQEIPVTVRWSFSGDNRELQYAYSNLQIRSPLFDQFTFKEQPRQLRTALVIATAKGGMEVDAKVTKEERADKTFVVVTAELILVADTPGDYNSIPITCRTKRVTEWGRDLFGDLVAGNAVPARAVGEPLTFTIKPIPEANRPASFSGAVGTSFTLEVAANRSEVRVGDPISLTVTVRGTGNVEKLSLPNLQGPEGLPAEHFQVPTEQVAGKSDGQSKQFKVSIRVKDQSVTRIPPLTLAWFNPELEQFQTTQSLPIALQVLEAQVVSASDVVSAAPQPTDRSASAVPAGEGDNETRADSNLGSFVNANLAIVRDPTVLLASTPLWATPRTFSFVLYGAAVAVLIAGAAVRRAGQVEPSVVQRRQRLKVLHSDVSKAVQMPPREAADQVARALREVIAQYHLPHRDLAESLVAQSERVIFSTTPSERTNIDELIRQALEQIDEAKAWL